MPRLTVARTFMRSSSAEQGVELPSFDEPSASLDPTAERGTIPPDNTRSSHGYSNCSSARSLLTTRESGRNERMIFSTHKSGNLTRHADLILYVD
jgi:hypothetical protein